MKQKNEIPDKEQEREYIRETIVGRSKGYWCKRILFLFLLVVVLSGAAGITFAISNGWMQRKIEEETTSASEESSQTMQETEPSTETENPSKYQKEDFTLEQEAYKKIEKSIVTISVTEQSVDWFDTALEQVKETFGIIIDIVNNDILILTNTNDVGGNGSITVQIGDMELPATVKDICWQDNMALIVVDHEKAEPVIGMIEAIPIGDSSQVQLGDSIILAGSPLGYVNSVLFGMVSYMEQSTAVADGSYQMYYTNIQAPVNSSGFLLNTNGELIGWINESYKKTALYDFVACIGINDLNYVIKGMREGHPIALLGAEGMDVTDEIAEQTGLPNGFFLTGVLNNSPAYAAGMQNGDIIVAIDEKEVLNIRSLRTILDSYEAGDSAEVTVMRKGKEAYREIKFNIIFAER